MDFLEMLLEPIAELAFGFFVEAFSSAKDGEWPDSKCRVQTLFGNNVWWAS